MELIVGGRNQGKLQYAMKECGVTEADLMDGSLGQLRVLNHLQNLIYEKVCVEHLEEAVIAEQIFAYTRQVPDCIIICDEVGGGLVPIAKEERIYREITGRICCQLAAQADRVHRVICGIGMVIKGA